MTDLRDTARDPELISQLRRRRATFDEIAKRLGLTREQVVEIQRETLAAADLERGDHRAEEVALADDAVRDLLAIARNHDPSARTSVEAWNAIRGWSELKAKLLRLDTADERPDAPPSRIDGLRSARKPA